MPISIATFLIPVLDQFLYLTPFAGVHLDELEAVVKNKIERQSLDFKISPSHLIDLVIIYITLNGGEAVVKKLKGGRTVISGITFRPGEVDNFVKTITTGNMTQEKVINELQALRSKIAAQNEIHSFEWKSLREPFARELTGRASSKEKELYLNEQHITTS